MNFKSFLFIVIVGLSCARLHANEIKPKAILQAHIHVAAANPNEAQTGKIQPGSTVTFQAEIKNTGNAPSAPGNIYLNFVLIEPLEDLLKNRVFQTEKLPLPIVYPGQAVVIKFTKEHQIPSLNDFIKQNWNMRHYQAIIKMDGEKEEKVIGTLPIFFSAYYYEGLRREIPKEVPSR